MSDILLPKWKAGNGSAFMEGLERHLRHEVDLEKFEARKREIEREVTPFCEACGVGIIPYFPLESGFLTGKYRRGETPPEGARLTGSPRGDDLLTDDNFDLLDRLSAFAQERGHTLLDLAIAGLAVQPAVASIIAGATTPEQVVANVAAAEWTLSAADRDALDEILPSPHPGRRA